MKKAIRLFLSLVNIFLIAEKPKVSIITSIYNGDQYIEGFLKDITSQTIFKDCELLLMDANSPGNEFTIIKEYLEKFPNIHYTRFDKDPGLYGIWNLGIRSAQAEFITNANLDDRLATNCYEDHYNALIKNPDIDLVYSDVYLTHKPNETFAKNTAKYIVQYPEFSIESMILCLPNNHPMWRKSMHKKSGYFNTTFKSAGDFEMWLRAVSRGAKFLKVSGIYGLTYLNPQGLSTGKLGNLPRLEIIKIFESYKYIWNLTISGEDILNKAGQIWEKECKKIKKNT